MKTKPPTNTSIRTVQQINQAAVTAFQAGTDGAIRQCKRIEKLQSAAGLKQSDQPNVTNYAGAALHRLGSYLMLSHLK